MNENKIKINLERINSTDKDGKDIKDKEGNPIYLRHDGIALSQLVNAVDSRSIAISEYKDLIALDDRSREAVMHETEEIELSVGEASLLKKLFNNPQNDKISFTVFHMRTIQGLLEQLK